MRRLLEGKHQVDFVYCVHDKNHAFLAATPTPRRDQCSSRDRCAAWITRASGGCIMLWHWRLICGWCWNNSLAVSGCDAGSVGEHLRRLPLVRFRPNHQHHAHWIVEPHRCGRRFRRPVPDKLPIHGDLRRQLQFDSRTFDQRFRRDIQQRRYRALRGHARSHY